MQFWFQLDLFGQGNCSEIVLFIKLILFFVLEGIIFQKTIVATSFIMSTQARLYGDFIIQKHYLWHFQKTIVKIPCLMSTQARHDGDSIVQKFNPIVHHEQ